MEYDNINISNIEDIIEQTVKKQLETLMRIEHDQYLEENPGIKNGYYKRNLKTKYGEIKELSVPRNRDNSFHSAIIDNNKAVGIDELITSLYSNGVSTRRISNILKDIFNNRYSPLSISRITDLALEEVNRFVNRKLDNRYIAVMLDGLFFYLRRETVDKEPVIFAFRHNDPLIDVNTVRIISRINGIPFTDSLRRSRIIHEKYMEMVNLYDPVVFGYSILDFGALICGIGPKCIECPLNKVCQYSLDHLKQGNNT